MLGKGNYSVFGLKGKELGFEIKWVKKMGQFFLNFFSRKLGRVYTSLSSLTKLTRVKHSDLPEIEFTSELTRF